MIFVEYLCVIGRTLGCWCFLFYSWVPNQWAMNHCIYAQQLARYRIFVWSSQLILWLLLRLLYFINNDHNKCVTSSLGKWRSLRSGDHKFLTHQPFCPHSFPPLFNINSLSLSLSLFALEIMFVMFFHTPLQFFPRNEILKKKNYRGIEVNFYKQYFLS